MPLCVLIIFCKKRKKWSLMKWVGLDGCALGVAIASVQSPVVPWSMNSNPVLQNLQASQNSYFFLLAHSTVSTEQDSQYQGFAPYAGNPGGFYFAPVIFFRVTRSSSHNSFGHRSWQEGALHNFLKLCRPVDHDTAQALGLYYMCLLVVCWVYLHGHICLPQTPHLYQDPLDFYLLPYSDLVTDHIAFPTPAVFEYPWWEIPQLYI